MFVGRKKLFYIEIIYFNVSYTRLNHKIIFLIEKLIILKHNTSRYICLCAKKIWVHNKAKAFCSVIFVTFDLLGKIVQNQDSGKIVSHFFLKFFGWLRLWLRSTRQVFTLYACTNGQKNIL